MKKNRVLTALLAVLFATGPGLAAQQAAQTDHAPDPPSSSANAPDAVKPAAAVPANAPHVADIRAAQQVAESWQPLIDNGKYDDAYMQMSQGVRSQLTPEEWKDQLKGAKSDLGKIQSREFENSDYTTKVTGAPVGQYVILQYLCSYSHQADALETLVISKENGQWRVAGFSLK